MKLYEIDQAIESLVDHETGELLDYEAFAALQMERDRKLENMVLWYKDLTAEAKSIKAEEDALRERRKAKENRAERLRQYLQNLLCGEKFQTARCAVSYRKSMALNVADADQAAAWLEANGHPDMVAYSAPALDKRAITALVKGGEVVPGVELEERQSMTVR